MAVLLTSPLKIFEMVGGKKKWGYFFYCWLIWGKNKIFCQQKCRGKFAEKKSNEFYNDFYTLHNEIFKAIIYVWWRYWWIRNNTRHGILLLCPATDDTCWSRFLSTKMIKKLLNATAHHNFVLKIKKNFNFEIKWMSYNRGV